MDYKLSSLLGREEINLDIEPISELINGKTVLVTGAGGSIGSEICRQILHFGPKKLILLGRGEGSIYEIDIELRNRNIERSTEIIPVICDVKSYPLLMRVFQDHKPDVVYHAAAHKHVPLMEDNPIEALINNVFGTMNVVVASGLNKVSKFIMISTDKAVNPTNVMGATKRMAEMSVYALSSFYPKTTMAAVRFGNVLGSRGSVVPRFEKQIASGGPVTVTHPEMTRYFMTIPEASKLVIQAGAYAKGGEIFILDMGEPVKIVDLAQRMIEKQGYKGIVKIEFTGLRPGEKLYEELLLKEEETEDTDHEKIFIGKQEEFNCIDFSTKVEDLFYFINETNADVQSLEIKKKIAEIVETYDIPELKETAL